MELEEIDLRMKSESCTRHPVITFTKVLRDLSRKRDKVIKVIISKEDIPPGFIEMFVKNHGLKIVELKQVDNELLEVIISP